MKEELEKKLFETWCIEYLKLKEKIRKVERLVFNTENREIEMADTLNKIREALNTNNSKEVKK